MERIALRRKGDEPEVEIHHIVVFDEIITGLISGDFWLIEQWGKVYNLAEIIDHYEFPQVGGKHSIRFLHFLSGHSPALYSKVSFYEDEDENVYI